MAINRTFWRGKSVFVTGHTGFKGGWLATWLTNMGATVHGFALSPNTEPSYFGLCRIDSQVHSIIADIREAEALRIEMCAASPDIVFHLAAQPLVRRSYRQPALTIETNVIGTVNVLEAVRFMPSVRAVVVVTSDKCYENSEQLAPFRESDTLGGRDPYSTSKACAELICSAYRRSFFETDSPVALATARAGNVIGGGDWSEDRIIPDAVRAFSRGDTLVVRNPQSVRPWQHVLESLSGYLVLAEHLFEKGASYADAWNFGPGDQNAVSVSSLIDRFAHKWGEKAGWHVPRDCQGPYEHGYLKLDWSKAHALLGWAPRLSLDEALQMTVDWYRQALSGANMTCLSHQQIDDYERLLKQ